MATLAVSRTSAPASHNSSGRYLTAFAVWLPIGFIGASGVLVGAMQFFGSETRPLSALAFAVAYGLLAAVSWRRAREILRVAGSATAIV